MSDPQPAEAVKLIVSLFSGESRLLDDAIRALSEKYGKIDFISAATPFAFTDYYTKEFGASLIRRLAAFDRLIRPDSLPDIKWWTNSLERKLSVEGRRRVNIDPGYIARSHLLLATGKGYSHRPYLRDGIYADLTLIYRSKGFQSLPWTYPDYAGEEMIGLLTRIRDKYSLQLRGKTGEVSPAAVELSVSVKKG
ncbi:MAG: DUF4416 family protein [Deltaproteobacteria bacterium]|nr:DUF4416 family protein [Deltaproteobacteria bacterium]